MVKKLAIIAASTALLSISAFAAPQKMTSEMLDQVVAGGTVPECEKGNNGWGNGTDPTNPGSFSGATAPSKSANGSVTGFGDININPTTSTGR